MRPRAVAVLLSLTSVLAAAFFQLQNAGLLPGGGISVSGRSGSPESGTPASTSPRRRLPQMRVVTAGDGYASQYSRVVHFGLGDRQPVDRLEVTWPLGRVQEFRDVAANRLIEIDEGGEPSEAIRVVRGPRPSPRLERMEPSGTVCKTAVPWASSPGDVDETGKDGPS